MSNKRVTKNDIPNKPWPCSRLTCVYQVDEGVCGSPYMGHENSDSECFKLYPGKVLELLLIPNPYKKGQNG